MNVKGERRRHRTIVHQTARAASPSGPSGNECSHGSFVNEYSKGCREGCDRWMDGSINHRRSIDAICDDKKGLRLLASSRLPQSSNRQDDVNWKMMSESNSPNQSTNTQ
eukprot:GHVU01065601.1.p2 GENE.GHVU01065601.1~~GHVU01065601.1.p2  ORF type:complete len:109 (-),score=7.56 GHVU01065601.1:367-693(-)